MTYAFNIFTVPSHHFSGDLSEGRVARSVSELGVRVIAEYKEIVSELERFHR